MNGPSWHRQVDPVHQSPQTRMYGFFTHGTVPPSRLYSSGFSLFLTIFAGCLPDPIRSRLVTCSRTHSNRVDLRENSQQSPGSHRCTGTLATVLEPTLSIDGLCTYEAVSTCASATNWVGEGSRRRWSGERENQMSKGEKEEQFHELKTRTFSSEETGGLDQPDGCQEGPFINHKVYKRKNLEMAWRR